MLLFMNVYDAILYKDSAVVILHHVMRLFINLVKLLFTVWKLRLHMIEFMDMHYGVFYEDTAVVTPMLHEVIWLFINVHDDELYETNAVLTLLLDEIMLLFINVDKVLFTV